MRDSYEMPFSMLAWGFGTLMAATTLFYSAFLVDGLELGAAITSVLLVVVVLLIAMAEGCNREHVCGVSWICCVVLTAMAWASNSTLWMATVAMIDMICLVAFLD